MRASNFGGMVDNATATLAATATPKASQGRPTTPDFGRYEVRERLGAGACGTVYAARDPSLDREVAIKSLHPALAGGIHAERIRAEAIALAQLSPPHAEEN